MSDTARDEATEQLATLFQTHPAWLAAARHLSQHATSNVHFTHRPGEIWHLEQRTGETRLRAGAVADPDFVLRFTPAAIERLATLDRGIGDFAVELFTLITGDDPDCHVDLHIVAGLRRLALRGYVGLLLAAGPRVIRFGATHGIRTLSGLRRFVADLRRREPAEWETRSEPEAARPANQQSSS